MEKHISQCEACLADPDVKLEAEKIREIVLPPSKVPKPKVIRTAKEGIDEDEGEYEDGEDTSEDEDEDETSDDEDEDDDEYDDDEDSDEDFDDDDLIDEDDEI